MEYFDLCTIDRKPLGKKVQRGTNLNKNEYHLVVMAIMLNKKNEVLLTRRSNNKIAGGLWECTAGSVLAGENSRDAIIIEVKEEIGINVNISGDPITCYSEEDALFDIWIIKIDNKIQDLVLQTEEVDDAKYVTLKDIKNIINNGTATKSLSELIKLNSNGIVLINEK